MVRRVFISYSISDSSRVRALACDIETLGFTVWFDKEISGGQRWWDLILEEIRSTDVFIFAVSRASIESKACRSELEYAQAVSRRILPVDVLRDVSNSVLPPVLIETHRVDCTRGDKAAITALNRALTRLPPAPPLPDPLPAAPPVPLCDLHKLSENLSSGTPLSRDRQVEIVFELQKSLNDGRSQADVLDLIRLFRRRDDVLVDVDRHLAELAGRLTGRTSALDKQPEIETGRDNSNLSGKQSTLRKRRGRNWLLVAGVVMVAGVWFLTPGGEDAVPQVPPKDSNPNPIGDTDARSLLEGSRVINALEQQQPDPPNDEPVSPSPEVDPRLRPLNPNLRPGP